MGWKIQISATSTCSNPFVLICVGISSFFDQVSTEWSGGASMTSLATFRLPLEEALNIVTMW
jgi:hypothetical protein